jgi:RNA polymerase sigma factor (TIGR02999 family)
VANKAPSKITRLLQEVSAGHHAAEAPLLDQVYAQLRAIAQKRMSHERPSHTLQATALVHEAYLRLLGSDSAASEPAWQDRGHFYRAAAEAMRRILVEHARRKGAEKRGGDCTRIPLSVCDLAANDNSHQILALDDAIMRLQEADTSAADIVRLRFFAGLSVEQTAAAIGLSERTVKREWTYARAKLFRLLEESSQGA